MTERVLSTDELPSTTTVETPSTLTAEQIPGLEGSLTFSQLSSYSSGVTTYIKKAATATALLAVISASPARVLPNRDRQSLVMNETTSVSPSTIASSTSTTFTSKVSQPLTPMAAISRQIGQLWPTTNSSITNAQSWVGELYENVHTIGSWINPHITTDDMGDVVFEWWNETRKLTVYVSPDTVEYVKVWGPNIFSEMEDGEITSFEHRRELWQWLIG